MIGTASGIFPPCCSADSGPPVQVQVYIIYIKLRGRPPIWRIYIYIYVQLRCRASPATAQGYTCFFVCLLAGFRLVNENTCVVLFLRSMRPVLCLLTRPTKRKKYRAECPIHFVFEFWSKSEYPYSAKKSPNFGIFLWVVVGGTP